MKKLFRTIGILLLAIILLAGAYVAYVFIDYHRLGDQTLAVSGATGESAIRTGEEYSVLSWNMGFGAYTADYDFFMDGGKQAWAKSEEALKENLQNIADFVALCDPDLCLIQEMDFDSTRTYHVDERDYLLPVLDGRMTSFAQNYDSPFLFYPLTQPHGASRSGILTASRFPMTGANRVELPIDTGVAKVVDLDRCYSVSRIPAENGKELVLYNLHLSAYTVTGTIADDQLELLLADMQSEYDKGNYVIGGGDFNKDLLGDSSKWFGVDTGGYSWSLPIKGSSFDGRDISLVAPLDEADPVPSVRNPDSAYHEGQLVLTVDGFLVSPNVTVLSSEVADTGFAFSDHNPVRMQVVLQ